MCLAGKIGKAVGGLSDKPARDESRERVGESEEDERRRWRSTFRQLIGSLETEE